MQQEKNSSLDDIMKDLFSESKKTGFIDSKTIENIFRKHMGSEAYDQFYGKIQSGELIKLPGDALGSCIELVNEEVLSPDLGFNFKTYVDTHMIRDLDEDSPAYKAGIREGYIMGHDDIRLMGINKPITMFQATPRGVQKYIFTPNAIKRTFPQYRMKANITKEMKQCVAEVY
jgi:predicted metalloprotease with PDZ domain